jgi:flagellar biosynthesis protein FliQ
VTEALVALGRQALILSLWLAAPILVAALAASIVTGIAAWATQVQDPAVGLVPRVAAVAAALALFGPHIGHQLEVFATTLFTAIGTIGVGPGGA